MTLSREIHNQRRDNLLWTESGMGEVVCTNTVRLVQAAGWVSLEGRITPSGIAVVDERNHTYAYRAQSAKAAAGGRC